MPEPQWDKIGPRIKQAREEAGLDRRIFSIRIGVRIDTVFRYEEGAPVSPKRMEKIAEVTHTTEMWLRYGR